MQAEVSGISQQQARREKAVAALFEELLHQENQHRHAEQLNRRKNRHELRSPFLQLRDIGLVLFRDGAHAVVAIHADQNHAQLFDLVFQKIRTILIALGDDKEFFMDALKYLELLLV